MLTLLLLCFFSGACVILLLAIALGLGVLCDRVK